ncbi:EF-hand domain pair [Diplonema papillatum]|nr:EF-hand domain pair [Diplonema papillatum]
MIYMHEAATKIQARVRGAQHRKLVQDKRQKKGGGDDPAADDETPYDEDGPSADCDQTEDQGNGKLVPTSPLDCVAYQPSPAFLNDVSGCLVADEDIRRLFESYDVNKNGFLDRSEVKKIYTSFEDYGLDDGSGKVDEVLRKCNMLGGGKVSYDEFAILMLTLAQR